MKFGSFDGREDGEHDFVGLVDISNILATQGDFFFGMIPLDRL